MSDQHNDNTFFTNEPPGSLYDRFRSVLEDAQYFDVLVGYFRTSGFTLLAENLEQVEKIRILVGLNVDRQTYDLYDEATGQYAFDLHRSPQKTQETFAEQVVQEMEMAPDELRTEHGVEAFKAFIQSGKLEIRAHPSQNIHAKVYITRYYKNARDRGRVITGSSNFSYSGLKGQYEFNVELKHRWEVNYALEKFESLWAEGVDLSEVYVDTIQQRTWLNDQITPYELYLKFLYEYFKEEINLDQGDEFPMPKGFMELEYQKQAVRSAFQILHTYNGVFLADVVGLGKTYISAMLARRLKGRILVICPPNLQEYWENTFLEFRVPCKVESAGKLDHIIRDGFQRYDYIFIDEAHRFRNEMTQSYEKLQEICAGKKVILVSATPMNNRPNDIFSQLKLFQPAKKSLIPGVQNLQRFFDSIRRELAGYDKGTPEYQAANQQAAEEIRTKILSHVMVRRTRKEIIRHFRDDMTQRGLTFPELADPQRLIYIFDEPTERIFTQTVSLLTSFNYSRYIPLLYLKKGVDEFEAQSQRNVGGFMKGLLVKRLESSFHAFRQSVGRFIYSYERFIEMYDEGTIYIGKGVNIFDLLDRDDEVLIQDLLDSERIRAFPSKDFQAEYRVALVRDLELLRQIEALWQQIDQDPKLEQLQHDLAHHPILKDQKLIIFTESAETGAYLFDNLRHLVGDKAMFYSSRGGQYRDQTHGPDVARKMIQASYDPTYENPRDDIRLLISTDVLAEGINLHRANIVLNYDLPWNPTKVLQRVGRVNRVGTEHELIYIFNCFPTAQGDEQLGLEDNITSKIQAFHNMLGEDAKYLSDDEEVSQHELFGERTYRTLNKKETYTGDDSPSDERTELDYLRHIQEVRDDTPNLFEKIKRLPRKARTGQDVRAGDPYANLLTFFRQGRLKKFYRSEGEGSTELTFLDAADLLACPPETPRRRIPDRYYAWLAQNRQQFVQDLQQDADDGKRRGGGHTHEKMVLAVVKDVAKSQILTDDDERYLKDVRQAFERGTIPRKTSQRLRLALDKSGPPKPLTVLRLVKKHIPNAFLYADIPQHSFDDAPKEVVLSAWFRA